MGVYEKRFIKFRSITCIISARLKKDILEYLSTEGMWQGAPHTLPWIADSLYNGYAEEYQELYTQRQGKSYQPVEGYKPHAERDVRNHRLKPTAFKRDVRKALMELKEEGYITYQTYTKGELSTGATISITEDGRLIAPVYDSGPEDLQAANSFRERFIAKRKAGKSIDEIGF